MQEYFIWSKPEKWICCIFSHVLWWTPICRYYSALSTLTRVRNISGSSTRQNGSNSVHSVKHHKVFNISIVEVNMIVLGGFCFSTIAIGVPMVLKIFSMNCTVVDLSTSMILNIISFFVYSRNIHIILLQELPMLNVQSSLITENLDLHNETTDCIEHIWYFHLDLQFTSCKKIRICSHCVAFILHCRIQLVLAEMDWTNADVRKCWTFWFYTFKNSFPCTAISFYIWEPSVLPMDTK